MDAKAAKMIELENITGVIIAGGRSTRMGGGDKSLLKIGDVTILQAVHHKLEAQVKDIAINTNSDDPRFKIGSTPCFSDTLANFQGPLAGLLASMQWVRENRPSTTHIVTIASDSPFFPDNLTAELAANAPDAETIIMAKSGGFNHPVFALWPVSLSNDLEKWLSDTGILKVMAWVRSHPHIFVDFPFERENDPFFNINTPEDLAIAQKIYQEQQA
jgi:molybdenum cofactor guanylyltransferase